jgi:hypothetical protein
MKQLLQETHDWLVDIQKTADAQQDDRHKRIVLNYLHHASLELTGQIDDGVLSTDRTVEHPVYRVRLDGADEAVVADGFDAVRGFYGRLNEGVLTMAHDRIAVADWGFFAFLWLKMTMTGAKLIENGSEVDDPNGMYVVSRPLCMFWDFDEDCRLTSENLYEAALPKITRLDPREVPTTEEVTDICRPFLPA